MFEESSDMSDEPIEHRYVKVKCGIKRKLRVVWVGTDYDQDSSGTLQGLSKFGEVFPLDSDGKYGQFWPCQGDVRPVRKRNGERLLAHVQETLREGPIDAVIGQMWNMSMDPSFLNNIRRMGIPVVNIAMDDRHTFKHWKRNGLWTGTYGLVHSLDLACTAAQECVHWYQAEGCPAIYLPEASDPEIFKPSPREKIHDVCFVGAKYGMREEIVMALINAGINVTAYGNGWPNGRIATTGVPELFARSRIVLGVGTIRTCRDFYALKMRDFDAPLSGSLYLTHYNPDLEGLFDIGSEIETYYDITECITKVRFYLENPGMADVIGAAGRRRASREHTWGRRFRDVFDHIGL